MDNDEKREYAGQGYTLTHLQLVLQSSTRIISWISSGGLLFKTLQRKRRVRRGNKITRGIGRRGKIQTPHLALFLVLHCLQFYSVVWEERGDESEKSLGTRLPVFDCI